MKLINERKSNEISLFRIQTKRVSVILKMHVQLISVRLLNISYSNKGDENRTTERFKISEKAIKFSS